jgi:hypothetical protein
VDDLDRLYHEFVEILRLERPSALTEPMTVLEVHDEIIPYRRVRNPVGFRSNDDYEMALSRLLAGERSYVLGDSSVQEELRAGIEEKLPDIRRYRAFPAARVWLNSAAIPPPGHIRYAPPELRERSEWREPPTVPDGEPDSSAAVDEPASEAHDLVAEEPEDCPSCQAEVPSGAAYCPFCGTRLVPGACRACGAVLEPAWRFCPECGAAHENPPSSP